MCNRTIVGSRRSKENPPTTEDGKANKQQDHGAERAREKDLARPTERCLAHWTDGEWESQLREQIRLHAGIS